MSSRFKVAQLPFVGWIDKEAGLWIPDSPGNADREVVLLDIAAGNDPEPADPIPEPAPASPGSVPTSEVNLVAHGYADPTGTTPVGDGFWRAGLAAIAAGHGRLIVPIGSYRATESVFIPSGLVVECVPLRSWIIADWDRVEGQPAVAIVHDGGPFLAVGGRYIGLSILSGVGRTGGTGLLLQVNQRGGPHYAVVDQLWVSVSDAIGNWHWPLAFDGAKNDGTNQAPGIRCVTVRQAWLFAALHGYVHMARAVRCGLVDSGYYVPAGAGVLDVYPSSGLPGIEWTNGTAPDCFAMNIDVG